ncbi:MAG: RlmE family RNA methyltransferase [candidate division SR1 bacterium]|nr:RlmE family RNA methyltransferase [candidate division SR1 bacterium]RKW25604.1 MAG: RlmE family RNA methyltransferase [Candidatus Gracilibacteria bacterium]
MYNPYDFYFKKAKKEGYKARSAFKLQEIQDKFGLITKSTRSVLDIGCAPGSWLQYTIGQLKKFGVQQYQVIGFDLKKVELNFPGLSTYVQDITEQEKVHSILSQHQLSQFDFIQSDIAPNTIGLKDIDAMRSIDLLEQTYWMYDELLRDDGTFVIKIFMGPGFDEFVAKIKKRFGAKTIKLFKPQSCRANSKETYIVRVSPQK